MKVLIETINNHKGYKFFENKEEMDQTDWLMQNVLQRIHHLSEPALIRLSDFLTGLEANQSIAVSEHQNETNSRDDQSDS